MDPLRTQHPCGGHDIEPPIPWFRRRDDAVGLSELPIRQLCLFRRGVPSLSAQEQLERLRGVAAAAAPDDRPYRCPRCEVYGRGRKCWCCESEDLECSPLPLADSAMDVESVRPIRQGVRADAIRASEEL
jgi:hypothetical protein